jgi:hypothetical protein
MIFFIIDPNNITYWKDVNFVASVNNAAGFSHVLYPSQASLLKEVSVLGA